MDDLRVARNLGFENLEWQKESYDAEFVKKLDLKEWESKLRFWTIASLEFERVEETKKIRNRHRNSRFNRNW